MNYSDYIKEFEVASKIPDTANAYNEERVRMQKAEILAEAFCMPKKVALQWVAAAHNASFNCMLLDVRKNILEAERIARTAMSAEAPVWISEENDSRNGYTKSMPVVKHLQGYRTPEIFLRAQAFLYALERNGYDVFVFFMDNAVQAEMLYAFQLYGWKIDRLEQVNKYYGDSSDAETFKEAAFIIRKQQ